MVSKIYHILCNENIPVWFDLQDIRSNILESIAEGVENAEVVCCFITPDYQDSWHCQMELQYACERCKPIIPCILSDTRIWEPSNWLNLITRELVYVDFHNISESTIHSKTRELIDRIKEQLCTLQYLSSKPVNEPSYLFELIKHEYTRNTRIERLMNSARSYPIEEVYINLSIVETEEQQGKSKKPRHIQHSNTNVDIFEDIYGFKTSVDVKDLFTVCADETKKVLVLGRAGIGKSTFCRHVSYRWAKGEIWSQYDLVILIPLRYLTDNRYPRLSSGNSYSIIDIVKKEYFSHLHLSEIDERLLREQLDKSSVLWLLDGYDEIEKNIPTHLKDLLEQLLNTTHHILTSRSNLHTLSYTVQMEITGFTDASINHYVKIFFNQIQDRLDNALSAAQKLINFLKLNPIIWNIAHIPINLELICSLWSDTDWSETKTLTITALYDKIIEWLCRRYLTRQNGTTQMMKREVYARCYKELAFLETLAFVGMENDTILLSEELLNKVMEETGLSLTNHPHLLNIGILKSFNHQPISRQSELEKSHYFVHISFQEHFAARYLVNALKNSARQKAIDFIKYHKYNQRFQMVLTFISGLLSKMKDESCTDTFWDTISEEPLDLVGLRHIQLVISWIEETGNNSHFYRRTELMDAIIKWITLALSTHDDVRACKAVATIGAKAASTDVVDWLMAALEDKDCQVRRSACEAIRAVGEKITTRDVINKLVEVLEHENPEVRRSACEAIGAIGQKVVTSDVINRLLNILENDSSEVRQSACKAIGTMGVQLVTMDVIDRLLITLKDENPEVRQSACETLGIICDKTATDVIFNGLVAALENENEDITSNAYQTLGKIGEKAAINGVITALVTALGDPGPEVRSTAWDALIKIGDKTDTHDLINQLATALGSQNVEVKRSVCEILGLLGDKAATRDVIDRLVTALADADGQVKSSACRALGKMEKESANKEVIKSLLAALVDNDPRVRSSACQALGKVGEKAATDDVINGLMNALTDKNGGVKLSACEAFGKLVGKVTTGNMIDMLVAALNDQLNVHNSEVKRSACDALGKIGEKAASDDVINELITVLVDENPEARQSAFMALGKMGKKAVTDKVIHDESLSDWASMSTKISDLYLDLKQLCAQATEDINTMMKRSLYWNRSTELFTMLHTQQFPVERNSLIEMPIGLPFNECIVIFHCDDCSVFSTVSNSSCLKEFTDIGNCIEFITEQSQTEIFLVISGKTVTTALEAILNFRHIHAIYYFRPSNIKYPTDRRKLSGIFNSPEDLTKQLNKDISFFREQHFHTSRIDVLTTTDHQKELIPQLNEKQINFIKFQLFIDILRQTPKLQITFEDIVQKCNQLFARATSKQQSNLDVHTLCIDSERLNSFEQYPDFSQVVLRLHQLKEPLNLFILQKQLVDIQQRVLESSTVSIPLTVCGGYINVGIVLLGTKSLLTARDIARKAANNGLISVLFEIGIVDDIHLLNIDSNRVVFRLGATFHVESVNLAPDGIRYVRMKYSDSQYQIIKKQIRFETGVKLSWLTLGNYLYFLNQFEQAISYYNYLLDKLPQEHTDRSSIYNNMGLICALSGKKDDAEKLYDKALKRAKPVSSVWISDESDDESYSQVPAAGITIIEMTTHRSTIFGTIGDSYYKTNRFKLALDYYKKALESCNEPQCRSYYQRMIRTIIKET
ncbi:unnamed protein product [Rotaria sp. Silwood2]|nr:unnamed protein product [Rotaria sp. Silwood2]